MVDRRDDVAARGQIFGEPGVLEAVAAAAVREHHQRALALQRRLGVPVELQVAEERHDERRRRTFVDHGRIEHPQRQMPPVVDESDLPDPDRVGRDLGPCLARREQHGAQGHRDAGGTEIDEEPTPHRE
jgi:hypothetical protein